MFVSVQEAIKHEHPDGEATRPDFQPLSCCSQRCGLRNVTCSHMENRAGGRAWRARAAGCQAEPLPSGPAGCQGSWKPRRRPASCVPSGPVTVCPAELQAERGQAQAAQRRPQRSSPLIQPHWRKQPVGLPRQTGGKGLCPGPRMGQVSGKGARSPARALPEQRAMPPPQSEGPCCLLL